MRSNGNMVVGVDVGTTKTCVLIGEKTPDGVDIVGIGVHPSLGLKKGIIIDVEATIESIRHAVHEAERMADYEVEAVYTGISGAHIKGFNSHGVVAVKNREIKRSDIKRSIDAARAVTIPVDREIIHVLPQEYIVDDQGGIRDPLGMSGMRLEAKVHVVTGAIASAKNIVKCANQTGLDVKDIILEQLGSSEAVLTDDEKDLGSVMIDIGGGTTDIAVFLKGSIGHTSVIPIGGNHFTSDIAIGMRTPVKEAERIKKEYGCALPGTVNRDETIEVMSVDGKESRAVSRRRLCEIIEPRAEELFELIHKEIIKSELGELIGSGIVLTGGSALMPGIKEMAEKMLRLPVRIGYPQRTRGLTEVVNNPMYATAVGLLLYGNGKSSNNVFKGNNGPLNSLVKTMRGWFFEFI
ncbi:MAG: cell division protein FtsA [Deltaproteobacteria bacterium]|nr:cell division protein FtsA [Deltaproteobacteria bacterium]